MRNFLYILFFAVSFSACTDKSTELANDWCSCMKRSGLNNAMRGPASFGEFDMKSPCFDELGKEMYDVLKGMTNDQRARFMKSFSQELLETDCADMVFNLLPYDEIIEEFARKYDTDDSNFFDFNSTDVCDCINMPSNPSQQLKEDCKKLEKEWKEKYEMADEHEKEALIKEAEDCEKMK